MKWLELHIDTTHAGLDTVVAMLSALDIDGVVIDDEAEFQDFLENNQQYWDYVDEDLEKSMQGKSRITFYLSDDVRGDAEFDYFSTYLPYEKFIDIFGLDADEFDTEKYEELLHKFDILGGYVYQKEYNTAIKNFGFTEEDKKKPLSDQAIADKLKEQGILVARRTVAKYRENNLRILPASQRKRAV